MGEVETLKESGSRGLGLRVFLGKRSGSASTSDLTAEGIRQLVEGALALAHVTEEDPFAGLPETGEFGKAKAICTSTLTMCTRSMGRSGSSGRGGPRPRRWPPTRASRTPTAAASMLSTGRKAMANSRGFVGSYRTSYAGVAAAPLAKDAEWQECSATAGGRARGVSAMWNLLKLSAQEAARRTLRRLGARRVPTQSVPIIFAPETARTLIGSVFEAASGDAIWRSASFLAGKLGETIGARERDHCGRQHDAAAHGRGRIRHLAFRRRGPGFAAHRRGGERHAAQLPAQHLHRAQARHEVDAQRRTRIGGCAGSRLRQSLPDAGNAGSQRRSSRV
jgi:PmbA protein